MAKIVGTEGETTGAVYKITIGRPDIKMVEMGAPINARMGLNTWAAFYGSDADAVVAINMVHIAPWAASLGLLDGAARLLDRGAPLILYGPWIERDVPTAASNLAFDADLRARNPQWGLREVEQFADEAARRGLELVERRAMPANNLMLLLRRL